MDGVIVIDKPTGKTSHDVVVQVKKALPADKAGHTGTLDPIATGVLPVLLNEATKLSPFFQSETKDYLVTMLLGTQTDTYDREGKIINCRPVAVSGEKIAEMMQRFIGKIRQIPPVYSAIKHQGKALYKWLRRGHFVEPPGRNVEIYSIELKNIDLPYVIFSVSCSKGTYMRSLCHDIGNIIGCGACLYNLRRTRSGFFEERMALDIENMDLANKREIMGCHIIPITALLKNIAEVVVDREAEEKIRCGCQPSVTALRNYHIPFLAAGDMVKFISIEKKLVAIAKMLYPSVALDSAEDKQQAVRILRVFNT